MKILVPIKRVVDANVNVRVKTDQTGVETVNVKMSMNPFCEIAVEEALRIREKGHAEEVIVISVGNEKCQETLRTALAMGADRAILIKTEENPEPLAIAKLLKTVAMEEKPAIIMLGKQAIDGDNNQTGQMLAGLLGWPQGTFASEVDIQGERVHVTREIDGGLETLDLKLPAVITTDLRLNEPRYAALPNIMKAKKKPLDIKTPEELGVDISRRTTIVKVVEPPKRQGGVKVENVAELIEKLRELKLVS